MPSTDSRKRSNGNGVLSRQILLPLGAVAVVVVMAWSAGMSWGTHGQQVETNTHGIMNGKKHHEELEAVVTEMAAGVARLECKFGTAQCGQTTEDPDDG